MNLEFFVYKKFIVLILDVEMLEYDFEFLRFSRRSLERILNDWIVVKFMIRSGMKGIVLLDVVYED